MANLQTQLAQMIDPEVMATMLDAQLPKQIRFSSIAPVDYGLAVLPGAMRRLSSRLVVIFHVIRCHSE